MLPELVRALGFTAGEGAGLRGGRLPGGGGGGGEEEALAGARRHLRPRLVPARVQDRDDSHADPRRERARADRPGRGARALRRRAEAGAGLHRAPRRPVGQAARARPASGRRERPQILREYGSLEARAEGRTIRADCRGFAPLPANSHVRRLRPSPSPRRSVPSVGGGVPPPCRAGA